MAVEQKSIIASPALKELSIWRRQCRYINESSLRHNPYYYTESLCRISCRIQMALKLCSCVPFFYFASKSVHMAPIDWVAPVNLKILIFFVWDNSDEKSCTPAGLYCLSKSDWYKSECECLPLCGDEIYVKSSTIYYVCLGFVKKSKIANLIRNHNSFSARHHLAQTRWNNCTFSKNTVEARCHFFLRCNDGYVLIQVRWHGTCLIHVKKNCFSRIWRNAITIPRMQFHVLGGNCIFHCDAFHLWLQKIAKSS